MLKGIIVIVGIFLGIVLILFGTIFFSITQSHSKKNVLADKIIQSPTPIYVIPQAPEKEFLKYTGQVIPKADFSITLPANWILWYKIEATTSGVLTVDFDGYPTDVKPPKPGTRWGGLIISVYPPVFTPNEWIKKYTPKDNELVALQDRRIGEMNSYLLESKQKSIFSNSYVVLTNSHSYFIDFYKNGRQGARERTIEDLFLRFVFQ